MTPALPRFSIRLCLYVAPMGMKSEPGSGTMSYEMRTKNLTTQVTLTLLLTCGTSRAGLFTITEHTATGQGTANVFDGGPPVTDFFDPFFFGFSMLALDATQSGTQGASASASGRSLISQFDNTLFVTASFRVVYLPAFTAGGDFTGGTAEGEMQSIVEFEMPISELTWFYVVNIDVNTGFTGVTNVVVENLTSGESLLSLSGATPETWTTLHGEVNDVIRITTNMSGSGTAPETARFVREYDTRLDMNFVLPEPSTALLLALGAPLILPRRHKSRHLRHA